MAWKIGFWPCLQGIIVVKLTEVGASSQLWVRQFLDENLSLYKMLALSCASAFKAFLADGGCDVA